VKSNCSPSHEVVSRTTNYSPMIQQVKPLKWNDRQ
jgi:hypothetical protein